MTSKPQSLRDLPGLGPKSEEQLQRLGFDNVETFMAHDPLTIYQAYSSAYGKNLNALYAIVGAQQGCDWRQIKRTRKTQLLMRLDDLGLAP